MPQRKLEIIYIVRTKHELWFDGLCYKPVDEQERKRVEKHLQNWFSVQLTTMLKATDTVLKQSHSAGPTHVYYATILRESGSVLFHVDDQSGIIAIIAKIVLPLAVSALLLIFLIRIPTDCILIPHRLMHCTRQWRFQWRWVVQAIEKEYAGAAFFPNLE